MWMGRHALRGGRPILVRYCAGCKRTRTFLWIDGSWRCAGDKDTLKPGCGKTLEPRHDHEPDRPA